MGKAHTVEVLLHVLRDDLSWFHSSKEHKKELLKVLSDQIIPKECEEEIDRYQELRNRLHRTPKVTVGEKNHRKKGKGGKKQKAPDADEAKPEKPTTREICNVFGDNLRLVYRVEETNSYETATLIFSERNELSDRSSDFRQRSKLSKRFVLWCYPLNKSNPTEPIQDEGGGFPRPEMIPIASIFRKPPELV